MSACKFSGTDCDGPGANEMCATCYGYMVGHAAGLEDGERRERERVVDDLLKWAAEADATAENDECRIVARTLRVKAAWIKDGNHIPASERGKE